MITHFNKTFKHKLDVSPSTPSTYIFISFSPFGSQAPQQLKCSTVLYPVMYSEATSWSRNQPERREMTSDGIFHIVDTLNLYVSSVGKNMLTPQWTLVYNTFIMS